MLFVLDKLKEHRAKKYKSDKDVELFLKTLKKRFDLSEDILTIIDTLESSWGLK